MFRDKDLLDNGSYTVETSETRLSQPDSGQNMGKVDEKIKCSGNGLNFLGESERDREDSSSKEPLPLDLGQNLKVQLKSVKSGFHGVHNSECGFQSKPGNSGCQELTLGYLCDNPKSVFLGKNLAGRGLLNLKGKGVDLENSSQPEKWVERDFLQLNNSEGSLSKREYDKETKRDRDCTKKAKLETQTLKLSLALPDVSLSLTRSHAAPNCDARIQLKSTRTTQSLALSNNNTQTTFSNDFMSPSLSYSYSHPFSHNPSCSLTRNSTENYENSDVSRRRETDQFWHCGEGTNGSVHSRFKPIGDGPTSSNHCSGVFSALLNRGHPINRDSSNSFYRAAGSDSSSFFPSELPARPGMEPMYSVDSMSRSSDHLRVVNSLEDTRACKLSGGEKIVRDVIMEPIPVMSQAFQEFPIETIQSAQEYVRRLTTISERKDELVELKNLLERKADLTNEALSKSHKAQLEILVAIRFGLNEFVSGKACLPTSELVEIFLFARCRNVNCKSLLPVDDCDCKICSSKKGFCSQCMCPVCCNYDCASNTCSWVGCDTCSHWCHATCGIEKKLIRPGHNKGSSGTTEMQFYCLGCGHASEMFGFVKDVFLYCAKDWGLETLIKELDCVRRIFKGSEDLKGKELYLKAAELITRLERRVISPLDAYNVTINFFTTEKEEISKAAGIGAKDLTTANQTALLSSSNVPLKSSPFNTSSASVLQDSVNYDLCQSTPKPYVGSDRLLENKSSGKLSRNDGIDSLETIVRIKEAESRMFQNRADEARKEAEAYREMVKGKTEKLEEEYSDKLAKLCLQESEEKRRKKLEELKILETSHSDYCKMKIRMQAEISGLLERMEVTKQQWV